MIYHLACHIFTDYRKLKCKGVSKFRSNLACTRDLFDSIPVGLQLPYLQCASVEASEIPNSLIPFLNVLPNSLKKELHFNEFDEDDTNKIISGLQNNESKFYQSLTTLPFDSARVDDGGFEKLLFEVILTTISKSTESKS